MNVDIRSILEIARQSLAIFAPLTTTQVDDRALELLDLLMSSDSLIDWIESLLPRSEPPTMVLTAVPESVKADAEALGASWATWIQYLPAIIAFLRKIRNR